MQAGMYFKDEPNKLGGRGVDTVIPPKFTKNRGREGSGISTELLYVKGPIYTNLV